MKKGLRLFGAGKPKTLSLQRVKILDIDHLFYKVILSNIYTQIIKLTTEKHVLSNRVYKDMKCKVNKYD